MELLRGDGAGARPAISGEMDMLVDQHCVQAGDGVWFARQDFSGFLTLLNDSHEQRHCLGETALDVAGMDGKRRPYDRGIASNAAQQPPEVGPALEEGLGDVDNAVELVEREEITLGHGSDRVVQLDAASQERLGGGWGCSKNR